MYCVVPTHGNQYWYLDAHCSWYMITTKGKGSPIVHVMSTPVIYEWTKSLLIYTPVDSLGSCNDLSHQMISNIGAYWHPSRHHVHLSPGYKCLGVQLRDVSKYLPGKRSICEATTRVTGTPTLSCSSQLSYMSQTYMCINHLVMLAVQQPYGTAHKHCGHDLLSLLLGLPHYLISNHHITRMLTPLTWASLAHEILTIATPRMNSGKAHTHTFTRLHLPRLSHGVSRFTLIGLV